MFQGFNFALGMWFGHAFGVFVLITNELTLNPIGQSHLAFPSINQQSPPFLQVFGRHKSLSVTENKKLK